MNRLDDALRAYVYSSVDSVKTELALVVALRAAGKLDSDETPVRIFFHTDGEVQSVNVERTNGDVDCYGGRFYHA